MPNAYFTIARPQNDVFRGYLPGSKERAELKEELTRQAEQVVKIPLIIGGKEIFTEKTFKVTMPHDHGHTIRFAPPIPVTYEEMDDALARITRALSR